MIFQFKILMFIYFVIYCKFFLCSPLFAEISFTALILYFRLSSFPYWTLWKFWNPSSVCNSHLISSFFLYNFTFQVDPFSLLFTLVFVLTKKLSVSANYCVLLLLFHFLFCLQRIRVDYQSRLIDKTSSQSSFLFICIISKNIMAGWIKTLSYYQPTYTRF